MNLEASRSDSALISAIAARALHLSVGGGVKTELDLTACHLNGCPLRLAELLDAADVHFIHDLSGIQRHLDRSTGQLVDHFSPRFAQEA